MPIPAPPGETKSPRRPLFLEEQQIRRRGCALKKGKTLGYDETRSGEEALSRMRRRSAGRAGDGVMPGLWDFRLSNLAMTVAEDEPPPGLLAAIEQALDGDEARLVRRNFRMAGWAGTGLGFALGAAAAMAALQVVGVAPLTQEGPITLTPVSTAPATEMIEISFSPDGDHMVLNAPSLATPEGKSLEVWLVTDDSAAPKSLGLVQPRGRATLLAISAQDRADLKAGGAIAISMEVAGGSPIAAPQGDILFIGAAAPPG